MAHSNFTPTATTPWRSTQLEDFTSLCIPGVGPSARECVDGDFKGLTTKTKDPGQGWRCFGSKEDEFTRTVQNFIFVVDIEKNWKDQAQPYKNYFNLFYSTE